MGGESSNGPSKRPREDNCIDLAEDVDLKSRVRELEKENKRMKEVEGEDKELREAMEELRGMVECPVCLLVTRQGGPVPVCSNGHFVCGTCRDRIRQETLVGEPKCPSCMVALGNATSLLASRVIEKLKHECEHEGCDEMIPFADLEKHQLVCLFRNVLCPGIHDCSLEISFNMVEEHVKTCDDIVKPAKHNSYSRSHELSTKKDPTIEDIDGQWKTEQIMAFGKSFFARYKIENRSHFSEVIMLGSEAECRGYLASITILDDDGKVFTRKDCRPRPISLEEWGDMGLVVTEKALSSIWVEDGEDFVFNINVSVEKV